MIILPILTTTLILFSLKGCENVLFELGSERVIIAVGGKFTRSIVSYCPLAMCQFGNLAYVKCL